MLLFRYPANSTVAPSEEALGEMHRQWGAFIGNLALQEKLVSTNQLGDDGCQLHADGTVDQGMSMQAGIALGGNMILRATSLQEAADVAKHCPILLMGGSVEVRNIQPM